MTLSKLPKTWPILILFVVLASQALNQSFWLDETASVVIAHLKFANLLTAIRGDFHPPLFYLLLQPFLRLGITTEWILRLPNLLISILSLLVFYQICLLLKLKHSSFALLLLATNPFFLYYSIELRMYPLSLLLALLSWYALLQPRQTRFWQLVFFISSLLHFYTFYGGLFVYISQSIYLFLYRKQSRIFLFLNTCGLFVAFLPWLPTLMAQLQGGNYLTTHLSGWASLSGSVSTKSLLLIWLKFASGRINLSFHPLIFFFVAFHSLVTLLAFIRGLRSSDKALVFWIFTPLILATLLSFSSPMLGYWRYLYLLPAVVLVTAIGIDHFPRLITNVLVPLILALNLSAWMIFLIIPEFHREDWRAALNWVDKDSAMLVAFGDRFAPMVWYVPDQPVISPLKNLQVPSDLDQIILTQTLPYAQIYYFDYLADLTDPGRTIKQSLNNAGFIPVTSRTFTGLGSVTSFESL